MTGNYKTYYKNSYKLVNLAQVLLSEDNGK
jgi:hypothetical protein